MAPGDIPVAISEDGLRATIEAIGPRSTLEAIVTALQEKGVVHGIRTTVIVEAIEGAKKSGQPATNLVVAEGTPPKPKVPPRLDHFPMGKEGKLPILRPVSKLLGLEQAKWCIS